jgi:hypothetical protein
MYTKGNLIYGEIESWYSAIGADTFRGCASITKVTNCKLVANGQEGSIGQWALDSCTNSKEVIFGTSIVTTLNTIGERAFAYCSSLAKIDLGNI